MMKRFIRFDHQDNPIGEVSPNDVLSLERREEINGEHSLEITTLQVLEKGERIIYQDDRGVWREYEIIGIDEEHAAGNRIVGTYYGVWSIQHDLLGVTVSKMPGVQTPVTAAVALAAALETQTRWTVGTVTNTSSGGASMYDMNAWNALGVLLETWGGELSTTIEVSNAGVIARKVDLYAKQGDQTPKRRYDFGADLKSIKRKIADEPLYCRLSPRGAGEETETGGYGRKITIESVNGGLDYLTYQPMVDVAKIPDGSGDWQYPTLIVENSDCKTPADLKTWAQSVLAETLTPKVTYTIDVLQLAREGVDIQGVSLGDAVHVVDRKFGDGLRVTGRVSQIVVNELDGSVESAVIGYIADNLAKKINSASGVAREAYDRITTMQTVMSTAAYIDNLLERINAEISADGGYTYILPGHGMRTYDAEVSDPLIGAEASKVVEIKGGSIRIANSRTAQGEWDWRSVFVSGHIAADLVTAAHLTAGYIGSAGSGNYWNLDTGELRMAAVTALQEAAVTDVDVEYRLSDSPTQLIGGTWSTVAPEWVSGKYMWQRTATTSNGIVTYSDPTCIAGAKGEDGTSVTILGSYNTLAELEAAHPTGNLGDGYLVAGDLYTWNGTAWTDVGRIQGPQGQPGQPGTSITVSSIQWAKGNSGTTAPTSGWQSTVPTVEQGKWLWCRTNFSDGSTADTASYQGTDGEDGTSVYVKSSTKVDGVTTIVITNGTTDSTITIADGEDGDNGTPGTNGLNGYVHTAWANSADGSQDFSTSQSANKKYLGVYTDNVQADSQRYQDYSWSLIKGPQGEQGEQGEQGPQGERGPQGAAAVVYGISASVDAVVRNNGVLTPSAVTFNATSKTGSANPVAYAGRIRIQTSTDGAAWTTRYTSSANEASHDYTPDAEIASSAKYIRGILYKAGGTSVQLDVQAVAIVEDGANGSDGIDGEDAYTVMLSNENHTFAGTETAAIGASTTCEVIAYKGATRMPAKINTPASKPDGMTFKGITNGTTTAAVKITVTSLLSPLSGTVVFPVVVDGKTFNLSFSYSVALKGTPGVAGLNQATVFLYKRAASQPAKPTAALTYVFSTHALEGSLGGWSQTIPSGTAPCWVTAATASSNQGQDTIETSEWSGVVKLVENGASGSNGINQAVVNLFRRSASAPAAPSASADYTFATGTLSPMPDGWARDMPAVDGNPCWMTSAVAISDGASDTITASEWASPIKVVEDGQDGIGVSAVAEQYYLSTSPTSQTGGSWSANQPAWESSKYIWTRSRVTWSDGSVDYTDPVLAKAINGANQSADTANQNASAAQTAVTTLDNSLNQQGVFNRLTNNGQTQGIYLEDGKVYINGTYIKTGAIDAELLTVGTIKDAQNRNSWNLATGEFITTKGTIGGFTIGQSAIYNGRDSLIDTDSGVYLGTNGFSTGNGTYSLVVGSGGIRGYNGSRAAGYISPNAVGTDIGGITKYGMQIRGDVIDLRTPILTVNKSNSTNGSSLMTYSGNVNYHEFQFDSLQTAYAQFRPWRTTDTFTNGFLTGMSYVSPLPEGTTNLQLARYNWVNSKISELNQKISNLQTTLRGKADLNHTHGWSAITGKPSIPTFSQSGYTLTITD